MSKLLVPKLKHVTSRYVEVTHENGSMQRYTWKGLTKAAELSASMQELLNRAEAAR